MVLTSLWPLARSRRYSLKNVLLLPNVQPLQQLTPSQRLFLGLLSAAGAATILNDVPPVSSKRDFSQRPNRAVKKLQHMLFLFFLNSASLHCRRSVNLAPLFRSHPALTLPCTAVCRCRHFLCPVQLSCGLVTT